MRRTDVARLLGATGPGAWLLAALYGVTYVVIAFWVDPDYTSTPLGFAGLAAMVGSAALLVLPWLSPFPHAAAAAILAACVFSTASGLWNLGDHGWQGWITWYIGASSYLAFTLALRGRFWWGAGILLAETAVAMIWTGTTTGDVLAGIDLTYAQLILFGAGSFFAVWLRRTADRIAAFQETRLRRESADGARSAAEEERAREVRAIRDRAGGALARIAADDTDDAERHEHLLLEAELRDRIRARGLARSPLTEAAREARRGGDAVALLDDLRDDAPDETLMRPALAWAAEQISAHPGADVTVRLTRVGGRAVITFATADGGAESFPLPAE